eukprot:5835970-Pyramimonas_sp.AAC.1
MPRLIHQVGVATFGVVLDFLTYGNMLSISRTGVILASAATFGVLKSVWGTLRAPAQVEHHGQELLLRQGALVVRPGGVGGGRRHHGGEHPL